MYPVTPDSNPSGDVGEAEEEVPLHLPPGDPLTVANIERLSLSERKLNAIPFDPFNFRGGASPGKKKTPASKKSGKSSQGTAATPQPSRLDLHDWDHYGELPKLLPDYLVILRGLRRSRDWSKDQKIIHKLVYFRGYHPLIPSWWRMSFRMWGITQSELDNVFTPSGQHKRVAIHSYGNELAAGKALEALFYLTQHVKDSEQIGESEKMGPQIVKAIREYYNWALRDIGLGNHKVKPSFLARVYQPEFHLKEAQTNDEMDVDYTPEERQQKFSEAVSNDVKRRLVVMAQSWRELLWDRKRQDYVIPPPTLYAFAVVQNIVLLVSLDSSDEKKDIVILDQIRFHERGTWLWNALSIAIPISIMRDAIHHNRHCKVVVPKAEESDPDL